MEALIGIGTLTLSLPLFGASTPSLRPLAFPSTPLTSPLPLLPFFPPPSFCNLCMCSVNNSQGVIEWEGQSFSVSDLKSYGTKMGVPALDIPSPNHVIGPNDPNSAGDGMLLLTPSPPPPSSPPLPPRSASPHDGDAESTLDIEWIASTGLGATNWFWLNGGANAWLYSWSTQFFSYLFFSPSLPLPPSHCIPLLSLARQMCLW